MCFRTVDGLRELAEEDILVDNSLSDRFEP